MKDRPAADAEFGPPTRRPFSKTLRFNCSIHLWSPGAQWLLSIYVWTLFVMLIMHPIKANIKSAVSFSLLYENMFKAYRYFSLPYRD